jgi:multicomponent Na+:H+ antiporter subunit D
LIILFLLFLVGFGVKSALMPLHSWLPTAMIAPTPVSALLHAVAVVKAGVFGFVRVAGFVFGPTLLQETGGAYLLFGFASATILLASLLALHQDNLKLRLAYSTVGHLSYIILGVTLLAPSAWIGGLFHIAAHAAMKITLFFCAGAIYVKTHRENVSELDGIGKQMPFTMVAFALASMGLAGLPPISGFVSKWYLAQGALEAGYVIFVVVLLLSGLLNAAYLFPIVFRAFFRQSGDFSRFNEASLLLVAPLLLAAALSLFLGLLPDGVFHLYHLSSTVTLNVLSGGGN